MEIVKVEMIEEFKNPHNASESYVLSKVEFENGHTGFEVQHEIDGLAGHTENDYFKSEIEARNFIKLEGYREVKSL